ncbi:MAG: hypothetical protein V1656_00775 [Candidatus Jorgensenbacteria bacterium]
MNRKQKLLSEVIRQLETRAAKLSDAARVTHEEAVRAPTPMESHSDRTRFEMQTASARQGEMAAKYEAAIKILKEFTLPTPSLKADIGSLVIAERDGKEARYFILPEGNGVTLSIGDKMCAIITPGSPLGKVLIGKAVGEEFALGGTPSRLSGKVKALE